MSYFTDWLWEAIKDIAFIFYRPEDIKDHPVNRDPVEATSTQAKTVIHQAPTAAEQLRITALAWLGKDPSPKNRAPQELSCAEGVVNLVNVTWPGTLNPDIVGTDQLYTALKRSPRFKGVLDPIPGCIEISPRQGATYGHVGLYTDTDKIASNDSRDGKLHENYTRASWRRVFIQGRGLKAYLFVPVDL